MGKTNVLLIVLMLLKTQSLSARELVVFSLEFHLCTLLNLEKFKNGYVIEKKWFVTYFFPIFFDGIQIYSGVFVVTV